MNTCFTEPRLPMALPLLNSDSQQRSQKKNKRSLTILEGQIQKRESSWAFLALGKELIDVTPVSRLHSSSRPHSRHSHEGNLFTELENRKLHSILSERHVEFGAQFEFTSLPRVDPEYKKRSSWVLGKEQKTSLLPSQAQERRKCTSGIPTGWKALGNTCRKVDIHLKHMT